MGRTEDYFRGRVALVTGGAAGIGLALVEGLLGLGARCVALADVDDDALGREGERLGAAFPGSAVPLHCDVTDEAAVQEAVRLAAEAGGGRLDVLVNNAGAAFAQPFDALGNADWERAFALNFYGPLYGIRAVLPVMRAQGGGHVVNVVSGIAFAPMAQQSRYAATKAALNALTLVMRYELWDEGIRFSSATPGTTATAIWTRDGGTPPPESQSPERAARTILAGVARNDRLVLGDEGDERGARHCFAPEYAAANDEYFLDVARRRRAGEMAV